MTKYILQEFNPKSLPPSFCDLDGTVRNTLEEARILLAEFEQGKWYSASGTRKYRIEMFEE